MKRFLLITPAIVLCALVGYALCRAAGFDGHLREMAAAALVCIVAANLGALPVVLARRQTQTVAAQIALAGTAIHMFAALLLAAAVRGAGWASEPKPFLVWLLALYWVSLAAVVVVISGVVRAAPPEALSHPGTSHPGTSQP